MKARCVSLLLLACWSFGLLASYSS
jgi:hypothetical protein